MALRRSPARSTRKHSRAWIAVLAVLLLVIGGLVAALLLSPRWLIPMAEEEIVDRLRRRLDTTVEVEEIELSWGEVELHGVEIGGGEDEPSIKLDEIVVGLDEDALYDGRAVVNAVTIAGGRVQGTRAELEDFAHRLIKRPRNPRPDQQRGRLKLVPEALTVEDVWFVVSEPGGAERERRVEAQLNVEAKVQSKAADIDARHVRIDPGEGPIVTAASIVTHLQAERTDDGLQIAFPLAVDLRGVGAAITDEIAVSGADGSIVLADPQVTEVKVDVAGSFSGDAAGAGSNGAKLWSAAGRIRRDLSEGELRLDMEAFQLAKVPQVLERLPVVDSERATVGGHIAVVFGGGVANVEGDISLEGLNVEYPFLARSVVRDIGFDLSFAAELDPAARRAKVHYADVERRGVRLSVEGTFDHPVQREGRHYAMRARVPGVPCQDVLDAIPTELIPSLVGFKLDGEFDADVAFDADFANLDALELDGSVGIWNCKVTQAPASASAERLASGFPHRVLMRDGRTRTVYMATGSRSFTSMRQISPYVVNAVKSTEDGGFFGHKGFMPSQFRVALRRNLSAGKVRLGASTITMQMVKNVLLSHERTLARKLQEMFLTWYVETVLSKQRIMELYLNGIEYGPGIYGVTEASRTFFGKHPIDLTPPEAVYIALLLPSPVRRYAHYCRGVPSERMHASVKRILGVMNTRGRLSDLELEVWRDVPVEFDLRRRGSEGACFGSIKRVQGGTYTQRALSGLLADEADAFEDAPPPEGDEEYEEYAEGGSDPSQADAPGRPAMDEQLDDGGGSGEIAPVE